jgi:3-phosphoshikimate 1-carboxyvinyltransferase
MKRPLSVYEKLFEENNMLFAKFENRFLSVDGPLKSGIFTLDGSVSSQFISGLLFALPLLDGDSTIIITPPFESRPYVDMTLDAMKKFGVSASFDGEYTIRIKGAQKYVASEHTVEGDWSAAAFIYALSAIGGDVSIDGLNEKSLQGDMVCQELFERLKARDRIIDISNCPDLAPILFSLASYFGGARFTGTRRLKDKESSRAEAMAEELAKFGISVTIDENSVTVNNGELHSPSEPLASHNDHRITMALAILLTAVGGEIEGAESVMKSYPNFFDDLKSLGIELTISE